MKLLRTTNLKFLLLLIVIAPSLVSHAQPRHKELVDSASTASLKMDYHRAILFLEDALVISKKNKETSLIITDLIDLGHMHLSADNMDKSLKKYLEALRLTETIHKDDSLEFEALLHISYYFMKYEDLKLTEYYLNRVKKIAETNKSSYYSRSYYHYLGILERMKKNYDASIQAYKNALELTPDTMGLEKIKSINNLATAYFFAGELEKSHTYFLKAEALNQTVQNEWMDLVLCGQIGKSYAKLGNTQQALNYYLRALEKAEKSKKVEIIKRLNRELARTNYTLGNYQKAYDYYQVFVTELESSHARGNASAIAEMSAKYEKEKNEQKIESLEKQKKLKSQIHQSQIDRRNLWIVTSLLFVCLTVIVAFIVFKNQRNKQRLKLELAEKQKELAKHESELKGQEAERDRLSRELHDGLGGTLASIKMRLSSKNIEEISPILKDIDDACQDVRNMSHSLNSSFINDLSFHELLLKLAEDLRYRSELIVNLEFMPIDELNSLELERRHQCYRIIQELSNNVHKHAHAKTLTIGLMKNDDEVILLVEDNGIGFDTTATSSGIGLNNVQKRLENIGGQLEITSKPNEGSTFSINFPFKSISL